MIAVDYFEGEDDPVKELTTQLKAGLPTTRRDILRMLLLSGASSIALVDGIVSLSMVLSLKKKRMQSSSSFLGVCNEIKRSRI